MVARFTEHDRSTAGPEALADELEDDGTLDRVPVNRRQFIGIANAFGGAAALSALAGCTGGGGGDGSDGGGATATTTAQGTPEQTQAEKSQGEMDTVDASILPLLSSIPIYVAQAEGYFEENGIELKLAKSISGAKETSRLATGQLDLTGGSVGASTVNAISSGIGMRLVADRVRFLPEHPSLLQFQVDSDKYEEGMDIGDTAGFTWGTNGTANVSEYVIGRVLAAHGLTLSDIELSTMPFPQMASAFDGDSIDATVNIGALATSARSKGLAEHIEYASASSPRIQVGNIIMGSAFTNQRPDVAVRWLEAYIEGIRRYYELGPYSDEVVSIYTEATGSPAIAMRGAPPVYLNRNGLLNNDSLMRQQDFFVCNGQADEALDEGQLIDTSLTEEAVGNLGAVDQPLLTPDELSEILSNAPVEFPEFGETNEPPSNGCGGVIGL